MISHVTIWTGSIPLLDRAWWRAMWSARKLRPVRVYGNFETTILSPPLTGVV